MSRPGRPKFQSEPQPRQWSSRAARRDRSQSRRLCRRRNQAQGPQQLNRNHGHPAAVAVAEAVADLVRGQWLLRPHPRSRQRLSQENQLQQNRQERKHLPRNRWLPGNCPPKVREFKLRRPPPAPARER
jgi:hypothetical protein